MLKERILKEAKGFSKIYDCGYLKFKWNKNNFFRDF